MKKELVQRLHKSFEDCAHEKDGVEYWLARELQALLGYTQWRNFETVIGKARIACETAGQAVADHFADVSKMVEIGSQTQRPVEDLALTRYACYLIAQNGDPRKDAIAFAMTVRPTSAANSSVGRMQQNALSQMWSGSSGSSS